MPPPVPVIVTGADPDGALLATLTVKVDVPFAPATGFGTNLQLIVAVQVEMSVTSEVKPLLGDTVTVEFDSEAPPTSVIGEVTPFRARLKSPLPPPPTLPPQELNLKEPI